ncbi:hypothetical protein GGU10DRAFT_380587 [Lentinula aff. detonsa]|uniref:Uncharacterized protein n=1 Tax=Lentinula aff. detonsa TaxID=2804958 RepID=A0AA38KTF0_9AGAR|nr:hypothetical protein GGU10DRAFT_380587 [Lentinula aff. detonsa]
MSTTSSPTRPARSPTPILNEEDTELQAFLAAAKREAQEKWEKLRAMRVSGVVEKALTEGEEVVGVKVNIEKDIDDVIGEEEEVVPKVEPKPRKVVTRMITGMPCGREMIPVIPVLKKRRIKPMVAESSRKKRKVVQSPVVVDSDSNSIPIPFPRPCKRCVCGDQAELFLPLEVEEDAGLIPAK